MLSPISWGADFNKGVDAYEKGGYATALREWTPLAEQGYARAQYFLGLMYDNGEGVPQDKKTAVKWYTLAAEQGNAEAQSLLGIYYTKGSEVIGVLEDDKTAVKWFTLAAEQGHAGAQYMLGINYREGIGVIQNYLYSHMWLNIAASNGAIGAGISRDNMNELLTPQQLERAQQLAREWVAKDYKGC